MVATTYPGFNYIASQLSAFGFCADTFTISLKDGTVVNHTPMDPPTFKRWLFLNGVRDISVDKGHHTLNAKH